MESNHKRNAKQPSGQTQRRADSIELQTACRYVNNLILDKAKSAVEATYPCNVMAPFLFLSMPGQASKLHNKHQHIDDGGSLPDCLGSILHRLY
jgi:hypothetical protein